MCVCCCHALVAPVLMLWVTASSAVPANGTKHRHVWYQRQKCDPYHRHVAGMHAGGVVFAGGSLHRPSAFWRPLCVRRPLSPRSGSGLNHVGARCCHVLGVPVLISAVSGNRDPTCFASAPEVRPISPETSVCGRHTRRCCCVCRRIIAPASGPAGDHSVPTDRCLRAALLV